MDISVYEKIIVVLTVTNLIGMIVAFMLGFNIGKFKGAKDGIDYCFKQYEEAARKNIFKGGISCAEKEKK